MSFTTRCPACGTMFRVLPDQLTISDGWVRCGHCSDVFDAMLNLQGAGTIAAVVTPASHSASGSSGPARVVTRQVAPPPVPPPLVAPAEVTLPVPSSRSAPVPLPAVRSKPSVATNGALRNVESELQKHDDGSLMEPMANDAWNGDWLLGPDSVAQHKEAVQEEMHQQSEVVAQTFSAVRVPNEAFESELRQFAVSSSHEHRNDDNPSHVDAVRPMFAVDRDADVEIREPGFVVQGRRDAFWQKSIVRASLWVLVVALSALFGLQWAWYDRNQLAARHPAIAPWLQMGCDMVGCTLAAPRRIASVVIDSSTLTRKLGQLHSFDLVIKNNDAMAVAMPALELSLTDSLDKDMARRVFLPEDMPGKPAVVPANGSLSVSLLLSLSESELGALSGFRALLFYP